MISLFRTTLIGLLIMAGTSSLIVCQADYQETYVNTITRAVGPTTLTGARGTLPVPVPTDGNSIWLAKNGNDANAGTQALPKLTVAGAIAALGAITNIHIFRNGYVGDLNFSLSTAQTLPTNATLQVEEGEQAYIASGVLSLFTISNGCTVNGIALGTIVPGNNATITLDNCSVQLMGTNTGTNTIQGSHSALFAASLSAGTSITLDLENWLLSNGGSSEGVSSRGFPTIQWLVVAASPAAVTINLDRCIVASDIGVDVRFSTGSASSVTLNLNIDNSLLIPNTSLVNAWTTSGIGSRTLDVTITQDYTLNASNQLTSTMALPGDTTDPTTIGTLSNSITNEIDSGTPQLLVDVDEIRSFVWGSTNIYPDIYGSSLQIRGKSTPDGTGTYFISSPLQGAGDAGVDINPWDETVTGPTLSYGTEFAFELGHSDHDVTFNFVNPVQLQALTGGLEIDWDSILRARRINWSGGDRDALNNDWKRVVALLKDKGTKKVYLKGLSGNFLQNENGSFMFTEAVFDDTDTDDGTITPADGSFSPVGPAAPLIYGNWDNFLIEVEVGASDVREYWIKTSTGDNNNTGKLYIVDKLGEGLPSNGTYPVAIRAFWAHLALDPLTIPWPAGSARPDFTEGNEWAEGFGGSADPNQERYQAKQFSLVLIEQPDPRTNTA